MEFSSVVTDEWQGYGRKHLWHISGRNEEEHEETQLACLVCQIIF
jgi:hypothetical protein